jgi:hypothetical protein
MQSTSTQISTMFKPTKSKSKLVDFCIYMQPGRDSPEQAAIDNMRYRDRPSRSINHVDSGLLNKHPIAISIETKREGEDYTNAINQMATWHSAQLRSLCYVSPGITRTLSHIELLPGIIVQGHDWNFVATIQRDGKAFTFHKLPIGTTRTRQGIFKVLLALQYLEHWIQTKYWSAFKTDILGMGDIAAVS